MLDRSKLIGLLMKLTMFIFKISLISRKVHCLWKLRSFAFHLNNKIIIFILIQMIFSICINKCKLINKEEEWRSEKQWKLMKLFSTKLQKVSKLMNAKQKTKNNLLWALMELFKWEKLKRRKVFGIQYNQLKDMVIRAFLLRKDQNK